MLLALFVWSPTKRGWVGTLAQTGENDDVAPRRRVFVGGTGELNPMGTVAILAQGTGLWLASMQPFIFSSCFCGAICCCKRALRRASSCRSSLLSVVAWQSACRFVAPFPAVRDLRGCLPEKTDATTSDRSFLLSVVVWQSICRFLAPFLAPRDLSAPGTICVAVAYQNGRQPGFLEVPTTVTSAGRKN